MFVTGFRFSDLCVCVSGCVHEGGDGAVRCVAPCLVRDLLDANMYMYLSIYIGEGGDGGGCIVTLAARRFTAWSGHVKKRLGV